MLFTFFKGIIKSFFVYFAFGFFPALSLVLIMAWSIQINVNGNLSYYDSLIHLTNLNNSDFLKTFQYFISEYVPFAKFFKQFFTNSNVLEGFKSLFEYIGNLIIPKNSGTPKQQMLADLFPEIVKASITDLILFFSKKLKKIFNSLKGISVFLGLLLAGLFWRIACCTFSSLALIWIEKHTAAIANRYTVYWCIFLFCIILRALLTAFDPLSLKLEINIFPFVFLFLLEAVFGIFNSIFVWLFFTNLNSTFSIFIWEIFLYFIIYKLLELFIKWTLLNISFPHLKEKGAITALFYLL